MLVKLLPTINLLIKGLLEVETGIVVIFMICFSIYIYVIKEKQLRHYQIVREFMTAFEAKTEPIKMKMKTFYQDEVVKLTKKNTVAECRTLDWPKETMTHITTEFHNRLVDNIFDAGLKTIRRVINENNIPDENDQHFDRYVKEKYNEYMSVVGKMRLYGYTEIFYPVKSELILQQAAKVREEHEKDFFDMFRLASDLKKQKKIFKYFKV